MRLWTSHPHYLDSRGLVALWREALLAQKVLLGQTKGYKHHPQLTRFRMAPRPLAAIAAYLHGVASEAHERGYRFDESKIGEGISTCQILATRGQLYCERDHLLNKLRVRAPDRVEDFARLKRLKPHPLFRIVPGPVAEWERHSPE